MVPYKILQPIPAIQVNDIPKAQEFYATHYGFHTPWCHGEYGGMQRDDMQIHFLLKDVVQPIFLYNSVEGVDAIYEHVRALGIEIVAALKDQPYGMREFTTLDPDGNFIAFAQQIGMVHA
jgi:predicted enzyme related to lactoylglutathione lyase